MPACVLCQCRGASSAFAVLLQSLYQRKSGRGCRCVHGTAPTDACTAWHSLVDQRRALHLHLLPAFRLRSKKVPSVAVQSTCKARVDAGQAGRHAR